jgi:hypothetical protein
MAKKRECHIPCPSDYDKLVVFLKAPDELNDNQEIEARDWSDWTVTGRAYAKIHTTGSRSVNFAQQSHQQVDSVVECSWNAVTRRITGSHAIRRVNFDGSFVYRHILEAINVDENNVTMRFLCRTTTQSGMQEV